MIPQAHELTCYVGVLPELVPRHCEFKGKADPGAQREAGEPDLGPLCAAFGDTAGQAGWLTWGFMYLPPALYVSDFYKVPEKSIYLQTGPV